MAEKFKAGVLIIGSLDWDTAKARIHWRESRLDDDTQFLVGAPIRYGRKSSSRGNTYTMVFSRLCPLGQAKVTAFCSLIASPNDLIQEAEALWAAEQKADPPNGEVCASWGSVGLLVSPGVKHPDSIIDGWKDRVAHEQKYGGIRQLPSEGTILRGGLLTFPWPTMIDSGNPVPLDFLLATATNPTIEGDPPSYPSAKQVAAAWERSDGQGFVEYFWNNRKSGIRTFEDDVIINNLTPDRR